MDWFPDWSGKVAAVVGSGRSATEEALEALRGRAKTIVVNTTYQRARWADALYACDAKWWRWHAGAADFAGLRITQDADAAQEWQCKRVDLVDEKHPDANRIHAGPPGRIGRGGNSGFQAANLAVQWGARKLILVLDFKGERWHGAHPVRSGGPQRPVTLEQWRECMDAQAETFGALGVDVVVGAPGSALTAYPKMSVVEALAHFRA